MKLLDEKGLTTVWAAIKNTFTSKSDADGKYAKKSEVATHTSAGVMTPSDKIKLDNIEEDANNYFLPLAGNGTRGGIQLGHASISTGDRIEYPLLVDRNEKAYVTIPYAASGLDGLMTSKDKDKLNSISSGANNYTLPVASTTALGGIKTNYVPKSGDILFKVNTDTEGNANTYIPGLIYGNDEYLSEIEFTTDSNEHTSFDGKDFHLYDQEGTDTCTISLPDKDGTLALTSDIPDVSSLCKFNTTNAIERCVYGRINFMSPIAEELNLDSILNKEGIIIFAYPSTASNITCSEGFVYNHDYIDNNKRVEPGLFLITISAGVPVVLSF